MKKIYTVVIEETNTGWSAYFEELPVYTTGSTVQETLVNLKEALDLFSKTEKGIHLCNVETINPPY